MNKHSFNIAVFALVVLMSPLMARADYSNAVMSLNPVAYWPLQETNQPPSDLATNLGSTGAAYDGIYLPGVILGAGSALAGDTDTSASFSSASADEGNSGFLDVPFAPAVGVNVPFTVEAWLNSEGNAGAACPLAGGQFASPRSGWLIYNNETGVWNFRLYNQNGTTTSLNIGGGTTDAKWHHIVAICDAMTNGELYIDGTLVASNAATGYVPDPNGDLTIGARSDAGFVYNGGIDEVAIYTNALSAPDILAHYQNGTNAARLQSYPSLILADNPLFYYRLDEPSPPAIATATNYGSLGAAINGNYLPGTQPGSAGPVGIGFGATNYACQFVPVSTTGNGGYVDCTANAGLNITNPMSVVAWFKGGPADNRFQSFLGKSDNAWRGDLDPTYAHWADGSGNGDAVGATAVNDGNWHFYAGVYDGTNNYVYVDGVLDGITPATPGFNGDATRHVILGGVGDYNGRNFLGSVAQVAVFTNALSGPQVTALFYDATNLAPEITQISPTNLGLNLHASGSFNVVASGYPVVYQWYQGPTRLSDVPGNILGSTTDTLTITNASSGNVGNYTVVVTNNYGAVTSLVATLTVYSNVLFTTDITPANVILYAGGHTTFAVVTAGASPVSFQWYSNNVPFAGATGASFTAANAQPPNGTNLFYCVATNIYNSVTSSVATMTVIPDPTASYPATVVADRPFGFWPLNETNFTTGNNGVIANDYYGGNSGIYTNTILGQPGYNPTADTNGTSAEFGGLSAVADNDVFAIPQNVDFSAPNGSSVNFSIEAWVKGNFGQTVDAGLVSKGYGGGGEQFVMDCGSDATNSANPVAHSYRFFVRDASSDVYGVSSDVNPGDNLWHHLVGVCDETDGEVIFYIDGLPVGTNSFSPGPGILSSSRSMLIGSRPSNSTTKNNDDQFVGWIQDVAVYNYALSAAQVQNHFFSADVPATIVVPPVAAVAGEFGTATFSVVAEGTPVVTYQWWNQSTSSAITGATNATLVLTDVQASQNGYQYYVVVANNFGNNQSSPVTLTVVSGKPQIYVDVQSPFFAVEGGTGSDSVEAYGTEPLSYQWQFNNGSGYVNLTDAGGITGSQTNVLTIANAQPGEVGDYQCIVTNASGSVTSSVASFIVGSSPVVFNVNGGGWQANGNAGIGTNTLTLTEGFNGETSSFFYNYPQYIGAFKASWTYQDVGGGGADGSTFCIQNDPRGPLAQGGGGGQLGVFGIVPSAELEFNIYSPNGVGYAFQTGGITGGGNGGNYMPSGNVNVASGDPINVVLNYDRGILAMTFTDPTNGFMFSTNVIVDLPGTVGGDTAYVGFTGADGGVASTQIVTNFSFVSIPTEAIQLNNTNAVISWPGVILGYTLQANSNLRTTNWVNVTNAPVVTNGTYQVTVPARSGDEFYRLLLQP